MSSVADEIPLQSDQQQSSPGSSLLCIAIIVVATIAALWPVVRCDFIYIDDLMTVAQNPLLKPPALHSVIYIWTHAAMGLYVPVTYTVWAIIAFFCPEPLLPTEPMTLDPSLFHGANLLIHVFSAVLVWAILRRIVRNDLAACLGALVFALHPVQVETVAWVSGLKDLLSGLFALVAIWQYLAFVDSATKSIERSLHYLCVLAAAGLAMLSKPSAMVLPVILLILDWLVLRRSTRQMVRGVVPVLLVCLPCTILAMVIQHPPRNVALWQRPLVVLDSISFYTVKLLWPLHLAPDYGRRPVDALHERLIWFCWVIPLIVVVLLLFVRRRAPLMIAGAVVFLAAVLPTLGFVNTLFQDKSTVADHYLYFAMFGLALLVAAVVNRWRSLPVRVLVILLLLVSGCLSFRQTGYWRSSYTLSSHTVRVSPRSWASRIALAQELAKEQRFEEAERRIEEAIRIYPSSRTYLSLGAMLLVENKPADAIAPLQRALNDEPGMLDAQIALAEAFLRSGRSKDAIQEIESVLQAHPDEPRAQQLMRQARAPSPI